MLRCPEVCRQTGLTYRQIDYWCRTGVITPAVDARGSGTQRRFTPRQAAILGVLARLRDAGVALQRLKPAADLLAAQEELAGWLVVPLNSERLPTVVSSDEELLGEVALLGGAVVIEVGELSAGEPARTLYAQRSA